MTRRASSTRARYDRVALAGAATTVTAVAVLGGVGIIPDTSVAAARQPVTTQAAPQVAGEATGQLAGQPVALRPTAATPIPEFEEPALPADSGEGRRVVFSEDLQRVWLVAADGDVRRTYLVSGSLTDNLQPGSYEVWSRSEQAWGIDDSGTMRWFVRFAHGERAAIGFHDIPVDEGRKVQTVDELGTPQSHGCIRQRTRDARVMWDFAGLGTTVVVV